MQLSRIVSPGPDDIQSWNYTARAHARTRLDSNEGY